MPDTLPACETRLMSHLEGLGITAIRHAHPPLKTVEDSKALRGDLPGGHCKNLFLKDKKKALWLVVTLEDQPINMKALEKRIGSARLSFGRPELLETVLGVLPGAVTPFALINDTAQSVRVVLDETMLAFDPLNYHPLHNEATLALSPEDLVRFVKSCGHEPLVVGLDGLDGV